jgi:predicted  nucleic acid-binding Zn-ribbon protein
MSDRKRMKKLREKRTESIKKQIAEHEAKIQNEKGRLDTTKDYWKKEIDEKFMEQLKEDEEYLEENDGDSNKESS